MASFTNLFTSYPELSSTIISCFFFLLFYYKTTKKSKLPTNWPIIGMLPSVGLNANRLHEWGNEVLKESGCTFKFKGPWLLNMDYVVTCDPANINHVFNVNFSNYPKGDEFVEIFDILGDGIFSADDESWKSQRKRAHYAMSSSNFQRFVTKCSEDKVENALLPLMCKIAKGGCVVDLQDVFLRLTFDLTCNLVFGVDPGALSEGFPTVPFARAMDDAMEALFFRHIVPSFWWKLMRWLNIGKERKLCDAWGVIDDFVAQNIVKKKEVIIYGCDMLTCYMEEEDPKATDNKFLRDTTVNLMLAGRDTTGVALTWFFWLLTKNPRVKSKILDELGELLDEKTYDTSKLVYLHAALCESLRLCPPVPFERKCAVKSEDLPSGKIKSKEKILFLTYAIARMERIWGEDCLEFKPERWISERGKLRYEPAYKFLSFNCGPRTCLGKHIALTQMKIVAISKFDVEVVEGHVVEPKRSIILHMKNGLMVRVKERREFM
ncbi:uncharacterized protein A4U43_C04F1880 [Asparagus officinalis]|uniref:noroxomaritidine synthase n=1 Tax=Asparagus officinalis TaxID=4686 RepID=A0A5P1F291_ASPOF|nr:alkane hydroxylase MAH1-like [Asparagus officinalis]ONK70821.1 uncharacterized protein A4U43_C04F1880 [Asparagus officinalis]